MPLIPLFNIYHGQTFPQNITPTKGTLWFDNNLDALKIYDGNQWIPVSYRDGFAGFFVNTENIKLVNQTNYTVNLSVDFLIFISANNNNVNITLPNNAENGRILILKRIDNSMNYNVVVNGTIDTINSITLDPQEYKFLVYFNGSWRVVGS